MEYSNDNEEEPVEAPEEEEGTPPAPVRRGRSGWSGTRRKGNASAATFVIWVAFVMVWLFFFAGTGYTFWENVAVIGASFLFIGLVNALMWAPSAWRIRLSIIVGISWLIFIVLWWPFYAVFYSGYQNFAVMILSVAVLIALTGGPWMTQIPREAFMAFRGRAALGLVTLYAYFAFLIIWLWLYAISGFIIKLISSTRKGLQFFQRHLDIDNKPLRSMAFVLITIITLTYLIIAIFLLF